MTRAILKIKKIAALKFYFIYFILFLLISAPAYAENLKIICSLFPQYDFAKNIAGDFANVELLIKPGLEPHDFEPSPLDIKKLSEADIFIFTGVYMEPWTERILNIINNNINKKTLVIDASRGVKIINKDPHIWLNLLNAAKMAENISRGICERDFKNAEFYNLNAENYIKKLLELDKNFDEIIKNSESGALVFAAPFAYAYFIDRYKLNYISAYDGENEPGMARIFDVINYVKQNKVKYIFYDELEPDLIAKSIAAQTGAELLLFNSAHNIAYKDFQAGLSFYEIMRKNLDALKLALN